MTNIWNTTVGKCWKCTEKMQHKSFGDEGVTPCTRSFDLVRAVVKGKRGSEVIDALECRECHVLVPLDSWWTYQNTGDIVLRTR